MSRALRLSWLAGLIGIISLAVPVAKAPAAPSPRVVVELDGMSVVLVAAENRISAYVDRIADNVPVEDATLGLELRGSGVHLALQQVSPGLFVAPFLPSGRDSFVVTLERAAGTRSQIVAELAPEVEPATASAEPAAAWSFSRPAWLLLGLAALLALGVLLGSRYLPARRAWHPVSRHAL